VVVHIALAVLVVLVEQDFGVDFLEVLQAVERVAVEQVFLLLAAMLHLALVVTVAQVVVALETVELH
jgi:hypothetical protein